MSRRRSLRRTAVLIVGAILVCRATHTPAMFQWVRSDSDAENDAIRYSSSAPSDAIARLQRKIDAGAFTPQFDGTSGYLRSLLDQLAIPVSSQVLVASNESFQADRISPEKPRAIYFGDEVYVGWVQEGRNLEVASMDPQLGAVFYTLEQVERARPRFRRQTTACLQCHDSSSLTSGVPGVIPLKFRAGGWSVTGTTGSTVHTGLDLHTRLNVRPYLGAHSDMVALMVLDHQAQLHNLLTRATYRTRMALHFDQVRNEKLDATTNTLSDRTARVVRDAGESLVDALLFADSTLVLPRASPASAFATEFARRGPRDRAGRSLFQLDLVDRLLRYSCSYLIYSGSFDALPVAVKRYVFQRLREVLTAGAPIDRFPHLSRSDRTAILEILLDTKPEFSNWYVNALER